MAKKYRVTAPALGEGTPLARSVWGATNDAAAFAISVGAKARCYVLEGDTLRGVGVSVLAIDGTQAGVNVNAGSLAAGDRVVVDDSPAGPAVQSSP